MYALMAVATHITNLPLELVQTVATFCHFGDLVALGSTCRRLHRICNDSFVLRESFLLHASDPSSSHVPDKSTLRNVLVDRLSTIDAAQARAIWASLAAAASQLPLLIDELESMLLPYESVPWDNSVPRPAPVAPPLRNIIGMLSTWTVLCKPTINDFGVTASLTGLAARLLDREFWQAWDPDPSARITLTAQLSFCLATGALANRVLNNMPLLTSRVASLFIPGTSECAIFDELAGSFEGSQTTALLVIACACWMLHSDANVRLRDDLPYPPALPLLNVLGRGGQVPIPDGAPSPGDGDAGARSWAARSIAAFGLAPSWSAWLRGSVDVLIDDISRGEWVGYYTNSFDRSRDGSEDPPLRNIHFTTWTEDDDPGRVELEADGCVDGVGEFYLRGAVYRSTGQVALSKQYTGGHAWSNQAVLTPLGIAGYWGWHPNAPLGFLWMYKKEWAKKPVASEVDANETSDEVHV